MERVEAAKYYIENPDGINDVSKPYACFHYGIKWIPEDIAGDKNASGFIVQRIQIEGTKKSFGDCKKLTLHVTADSYAEQYAIKAGIRYVMD